MKKATLAKKEISNQEDFLKMADSLSAANSTRGRAMVRAILEDIPSLDTSKLRDTDETIYLSRTNIELNIKGDIGIYSAALLSRGYKRTGFIDRKINLSIPASVNDVDRKNLVDRISRCVKSESVGKINELILKGAAITMAEAKELGLIDLVIDLSKRRGAKPTTAVVAPEDKPVSENQTATS